EQPSGPDRPGALASFGEKACQRPDDPAEEPGGVTARQETVGEVDPSLPRARFQKGRALRPPEAREPGAHVTEGARSQVRETERVAQEIVAVEPDEWVEVEDEPDAEDGQPHQEDRVDAIETGEVAREVGPVPDQYGQRHQDDERRDGDEVRREAEPDLADEALQQGIGIEGVEPQMEQIPTKPTGL